jgi:ceramide glucosyltransferase
VEFGLSSPLAAQPGKSGVNHEGSDRPVQQSLSIIRQFGGFVSLSAPVFVLSIICAVLAFCGAGYYLACLIASLRFLSEPKPKSAFTPPVTILKPVKGADAESEACFRAHFQLDYAQYQLVFGVAERNDPAVPIIEKLRREFPNVDSQLFFCPEKLGANRKVSSLAQMLPVAKHEHLVINDADMLVRPEYLREVMAPFANEKMGFVTCVYRALPSKTIWSKVEALGICTEFMPAVLLARMIEGEVNFGLGATLACTSKALTAMGGFEALLNRLADDYDLGTGIKRAGFATALSTYVPETHAADYDLHGFWNHQIRWNRTVRDARPAGYAGLVFTFGIFWSLLAMVFSRGALWSSLLFAAVLGMRYLMAIGAGGIALGDQFLMRDLWLLPLRDAMSMAVWVASYFGKTVVWRGERFVLNKGTITGA